MKTLKSYGVGSPLKSGYKHRSLWLGLGLSCCCLMLLALLCLYPQYALRQFSDASESNPRVRDVDQGQGSHQLLRSYKATLALAQEDVVDLASAFELLNALQLQQSHTPLMQTGAKAQETTALEPQLKQPPQGAQPQQDAETLTWASSVLLATSLPPKLSTILPLHLPINLPLILPTGLPLSLPLTAKAQPLEQALVPPSAQSLEQLVEQPLALVWELETGKQTSRALASHKLLSEFPLRSEWLSLTKKQPDALSQLCLMRQDIVRFVKPDWFVQESALANSSDASTVNNANTSNSTLSANTRSPARVSDINANMSADADTKVSTNPSALALLGANLSPSGHATPEASPIECALNTSKVSPIAPAWNNTQSMVNVTVAVSANAKAHANAAPGLGSGGDMNLGGAKAGTCLTVVQTTREQAQAMALSWSVADKMGNWGNDLSQTTASLTPMVTSRLNAAYPKITLIAQNEARPAPFGALDFITAAPQSPAPAQNAGPSASNQVPVSRQTPSYYTPYSIPDMVYEGLRGNTDVVKQQVQTNMDSILRGTLNEQFEKFRSGS